ncbi:MAG TPA: cell division protein ZapA [Candidatus Tectomicrobia bacterium]|nr:cell division protein ZapA [Candidatus Tectomicrobia bacterium]
MATRVELTLLGQRLTVRTEAAPEHVQRLARYLEERVDEFRRAGARDPMAALTLAALDIVDELFRAREDRTRGTEVGARLGALVALLDQVAPPTAEQGPRG